MVERDHDADGTFSPEHTDAEILAAVRAHEPAATSEVADELGVTRQAVDRRLRNLRDAGRVNSKKIAASLVWFDADADRGDTGAGERERASPDAGKQPDADVHTSSEPAASTSPIDPTPTAPDAGHGDDLADALAGVDFPSNRDRDQATDAVAAARAYIRDHDGATRSELVVNVMPDTPVSYDADTAIEQVTSDDDRYRGGWWRSVIKPGLEAVSDIEPPAPGASTWQYTGDA